MDTDKVIQDLNRRFAASLPEFYRRRIIFWYDEDKLDEVVLEVPQQENFYRSRIQTSDTAVFAACDKCRKNVVKSRKSSAKASDPTCEAEKMPCSARERIPSL